MTEARQYSKIDGAEQARLYRDRLTGLEQEHVVMLAARLAGDGVSDKALADLEKRMDALAKAAAAAEKGV